MWYFPEVLLLHDPLGAGFHTENPSITYGLLVDDAILSQAARFHLNPLQTCLNNRAISASYSIEVYGVYIFYQGNFYILIHGVIPRACLILPYRQFPSECLKKHRIISALSAVFSPL